MLLPLLLLLLCVLYTAAVAAAAAAVRHRVPDCKKSSWFIESDSSHCFFLFKHGFFLMYVPLGGTLAFTASILLYYIVANYGHARSQGGRQSAAANPPLYLFLFLFFFFSVNPQPRGLKKRPREERAQCIMSESKLPENGDPNTGVVFVVDVMVHYSWCWCWCWCWCCYFVVLVVDVVFVVVDVSAVSYTHLTLPTICSV